MKKMKRGVVAVGLCILALVQSRAYADEDVMVRPHAGIGSMDGKQYQHAGIRVLLDASAEKKYGLELTRVNTPQGNYLAAGIVLEQTKFGWFNMSIGTIGYLGRGNTLNLPGLVANLGWEPETSAAFKPFVTMRNDVLFDKKMRTGISLSAGLSASF